MINWISVKDRLPEEFIPVLVFMPDEKPFPMVREAYLASNGFVIPAMFGYYPNVTHWAEMPEGPGEVGT